MNFDFNWILVPLTLLFFIIWLLDKLVWKQRETRGAGNESSVISWAYDFWPVFAVVLFLRSFLFEPFNIPSGSMESTLKTGDFVVVNKYDYGVRLPLLYKKVINSGEPERGDIAVFRYPVDTQISFIKRVIGLPGDTVNYKDGQISINGQPIDRQFVGKTSSNKEYKTGSNQDAESVIVPITLDVYQEKLGDKTYYVQQEAKPTNVQNFRFLVESGAVIANNEWQLTVPKDQYFTMGDNRDSSSDSRVWGFVPEQNLTGRAAYIWMHKEKGKLIPSFSRNGSVYNLRDLPLSNAPSADDAANTL